MVWDDRAGHLRGQKRWLGVREAGLAGFWKDKKDFLVGISVLGKAKKIQSLKIISVFLIYIPISSCITSLD